MRVNLITTIFIGICIAIIGYGLILYQIDNRNAVENNNKITNEVINTINK